MINLKEDFFNTLYVKIFVLVFGLISSIIFARLLGTHQFGMGIIITIIPPILIKFANLGVATSLIYFVNKKPESKERFLGTSFVFALILCILLTGLLFLLKDSLVNLFEMNEANEELVLLTFSFTPVYTLSFFLGSFLRANNFIKIYNYRSELLPSVSGFILAIFFVVVMQEKTTRSFVLIQLINETLAVVIMIVILTKKNILRFAFDLQSLKEMIKFGLRSYLINIPASLEEKIDSLLIALFLSPDKVAIYSIAYKLMGKLLLFPRALHTPLLPKMSSLNSSELVKLTVKLLNQSLSLTFLIVPIIIISPFFFLFIYGYDYIPAFYPFIFLALSVIFITMDKILGAYVFGNGKPEIKSFFSFLALIFRSLFLLLLLPFFGITGAGLSLLLSEVLFFVMFYIYFRKNSDVSKQIFSANIKERFFLVKNLLTEFVLLKKTS